MGCFAMTGDCNRTAGAEAREERKESYRHGTHVDLIGGVVLRVSCVTSWSLRVSRGFLGGCLDENLMIVVDEPLLVLIDG